MTNQTPPQSPEQGDAELERILDTYGVSHKRPLLQPESRVNLMRDLKVWRDKHQPTEASPERPEAPQDIPSRVGGVARRLFYAGWGTYRASLDSRNAKGLRALEDEATEEARTAILALIREVAEAAIGEDEEKVVTQESYRTTWGSTKIRTVKRWGRGARERNETRKLQRARLDEMLGKLDV